MRRLLGRAALAVALAALTLGPATAGHADAPTPTPSATAGTTGTTVAPGSDQAAVDAALAQVRNELAESSDAMVRAVVDVRLADQALPGARLTAKHTRELLVAAQQRQARTARQRGRAQVQYMLSTQDAEQTASRVVEQQARLGRLARAVYQSGGSLGNVSMLLEAHSPTDLAERLVSLQTVVASQRSLLSDLEQVQQTFGARTDDLEKVRDQLATADKQAQADLREVAALAEQAQAAETRVAGLVATRRAALAAAAVAQVQDDAAHRQIIGTSTSLSGQLAAEAHRLLGSAPMVDGTTVHPRAGTLAFPVRGPVTSPFGMRVHPITGVYKLHTGTDFGVACGTPIQVALPGVVVEAGWDSAYGWRTIVSHGLVDGVLLTTTYNHQSHQDVAVGDHLTAGQVIGLSGTTGYSTGCHLHFELYVNAALVDPEPWLPAH